jgi:OOP family OmpA-OmpF porin
VNRKRTTNIHGSRFTVYETFSASFCSINASSFRRLLMPSKSIPSLARRVYGRRFLASVLSLLCLAATPAVSARSGPRDDGPVYVPVPAVASHQAQLILFRGAAPDADVGKRGLGAHVYVDGEFHGALLPNGWTRLCVAPGDHSIEAYVGDAPWYRGKARPATGGCVVGG